MSLIYSALNKLDQNASGVSGGAVVNPYAAVAEKAGAPRWVYGVVAGCVVLVLGGWVTMNALRVKFVESRLHETLNLPVTRALPVMPASELVQAPVEIRVPQAVAVVPIMTPVVVLPASSDVLTATSTPRAKVAHAKPVQARPPVQILPKQPAPMITEDAPAPEINPEEITTLTREVKRAIEAGKYVQAQSLLKQLAARLPAESITLLRLNAWLRMQSGDSTQAMVLYRQIADRLPGDETAGINLALLHLKAGQQDEARRLIGALAERHPESETVQKYYREIGVSK